MSENIDNAWDMVESINENVIGNQAFKSFTYTDLVNLGIFHFHLSDLTLALKHKNLAFYPEINGNLELIKTKGTRLFRTQTYIYSVARAVDGPGLASDQILAELMKKTKEVTAKKKEEDEKVQPNPAA